MVSLARKNLFEDLPRFLVAQAGIMLAVSLVTIQIGILRGFTRSTTRLIEQANADLWIASKDMVNLELTKAFPYSYVNQVQAMPDVAKAEPLLLGVDVWSTSASKLTPVRTFGFNLNGTLFVPGKLTQGNIKALAQPYSAIVEQANIKMLNVSQVGDRAMLRSLPVTVVGLTTNTQSIAASSFLFMSIENAKLYSNSGFKSRVDCKLNGKDIKCQSVYEKKSDLEQYEQKKLEKLQPMAANDAITYILVKAKPGQNLAQLSQKIEQKLPGVTAFTQEQLAKNTRDFWQKRTGVGFILGLGATVGITVGMVIVGQILYTSVTDHIKEFGTLKAMGASNGVIYSVILQQALWMAIFGYLPGMAICLVLSSWAAATQGIMILITPLTATGVFVITITMCASSAIFAIQKVTRLDPAIVFKA